MIKIVSKSQNKSLSKKRKVAFFYKKNMDSTLRLSEGAGVLDVYDHEEGERDISDEFEESEEEYDEYDEEEGGGKEEGELQDDLTINQEKEEYSDAENLSQPFEEENEEEENNQQMDPSLLALVAAQQQDEIDTPSVRDQTTSGEIKKVVYEFLMTSKNNKSVTPTRKTPSPPTRTPVHFSLPPGHSSSYVPSPENVRPLPISPPPPPEQNRSISSANSSNANDSFLMERNNSERESKEDSFPKEMQSSTKKYPTEFSANLIENYDGIYKTSFSSSPSQSPSTAVVVVPDTTFPIEKEVSNESIMVAAENEAFLLSNSPSLSSPSPPAKKPPEKSPSTLMDAFSNVNKVLGGKEAMKKIDENMEVAILKAKVKMLRDTTKNLRCSHIVDIMFGDGDVPKKPSPDDLRRLKNIIAGELTLNEFIKSSEVRDINSAELFRRSNENLEMVQRQQIMSNPLFSEISSASSLFSRVHQKNNHQEAVTEKEKEEVEEEEVVASNIITNPDNNLRIELFNLLSSSPGDPCHKLSDRVTFLNRLIHHKTAINISWTRLVNLVSNISSQAAVVLFGDGEEQETIPGRASPAHSTTTSSKLMAMNDNNAVKDMNMGSIGVDLLFGAVSDMLERNTIRVCMDIGELALYLNIPVVLLQWPQEFIRTDEYKNILMRSISSFSAKMAIPSMYIIDQIMFDDEEEEKISGGEEEQHNLELFSKGDKKTLINKLYNEIRSGRGHEKELLRSIFHGQQQQQQQQQQQPVLSNSLDTAYFVATSIIDYKIPLFDNIMNDIVKYLDKRKHLICAAVIKLLKKAKLNIAVYCIKNRISAKKMDNDAPMQNLMYRSSTPPGSRRHGGAPTSIKRPPLSILSSRIKRLKQWETTASSDESELSDEDTHSGIRDG
nr:MAG: wsv313-like protein [Chiromantes dehaani nimavirus]